jgi:hypothetical protein
LRFGHVSLFELVPDPISRGISEDVLKKPNAEAELRLECGGLAAGAAEQQA